VRFDVLELHRRMLRIRRFEERALDLQRAGTIRGPLHPSIGHEAACVGACAPLRNDDWMTGNHRSHGHPIAKGAALAPLFAELLGKATGVCGGRGGSMHLADFSIGSLGESGIVGAGLPIAIGAALSSRVRGTDQVALSFFGDGASNHGTFHESLNMAAVWKLPAIFVCENNGYAATTALAATTSVADIASRAAGYGMPGVVVDGQDVIAVAEVVERAVERARRGEGPSLVEAKTYRYCEHAEGAGMPSHYRSAEEVARWRERDPVALSRARMLRDRAASDAAIVALEAEVEREVDDAVRFAETSASPLPGEATRSPFASEVAR
jgi:TPP-dependent pyruvate/acetoin dehydrogenase alpha subunit